MSIKADAIKEYWIHKIDPLRAYDHFVGLGGSDDIDDAISRCRNMAKNRVAKGFVMFFRVVEHRGKVIYLALVNFDQFEEWDMREGVENDET